MMQVNVLILTGFGLNCDYETAHAFDRAGAHPQRIHINSLISGKVSLDDYHILALGGGFSWGDDHGAGVVQALKLKNHLGRQLLSFVDQGKLIIGICNGFQTLVNMGLLPALDRNYTTRNTAIAFNDCGNFRNQWVYLSANAQSPCVFTRGIDLAEYPVRHGEGKFVTDPDTLARIIENNQVVLRYANPEGQPANGQFPFNPNGAMDDIAGICDPTGRIFGLMPHPEAYNHFTNHPRWTRQNEALKRQGLTMEDDMTVGIRLFKNGVDFISASL